MSIEVENAKPLVTIVVNEMPVVVRGPRITGAEIKAAAIAQGVLIEADFVLSVERHNGETEIIGDNDAITVNKNSVFVAVDDDDNS